MLRAQQTEADTEFDFALTKNPQRSRNQEIQLSLHQQQSPSRTLLPPFPLFVSESIAVSNTIAPVPFDSSPLILLTPFLAQILFRFPAGDHLRFEIQLSLVSESFQVL